MKELELKKTLVLLILLIIIALLAGCGRAPSVYSDPVVTVKAGVGEEFIISLKSNHTTGYQWQLAEPLNKKVLKLVNSVYKGSTSGRIGAGGKEIWTFKAVGEGKTSIALKYIQPWEKKTPAAERKNFTVEVD